MNRVLRVGGVDEPFNLPFIRAFEKNRFQDLGVEVTFTAFAGGTGALVKALEDHTLDLATLLTEGAVTAIGRGSAIEIHSEFVRSPLRWGIHVAAASKLSGVGDLAGARFAISRFGSGSELMAYVLADAHGFGLTADDMVVVGGVDGAVEALPAGDADVFMWERFVTSPLVAQGVFKRIGELPTPWPPFHTVARPALLGSDRPLIDEVVRIVVDEAMLLAADPDGTVSMIAERHGMSRRDARTWFNGTEWARGTRADDEILQQVRSRMIELGRIDTTD